MPLLRLERTFLSAANYFRSQRSARKAQLKEVHHSNETSTVKVITPEGVTILDKPPQLPPKRINKPPAPPPPLPSRPPAPPPPKSPPLSPPPQVTQALGAQLSEQLGEEDEELKRIHEACSQRNHRSSPSLQRATYNRHSSPRLSSVSSSPELPLPPPPPTPGETPDNLADEPLPPPPEFPDNNNRTPLPLVYPKDSYMSYRNERKTTRQGFDGKYRRTSPTLENRNSPLSTSNQGSDSGGELSPSTWEQIHNIRKPAPTLIFHSESLRLKGSLPNRGGDHLPNGNHHKDVQDVEQLRLDLNANNEQRRNNKRRSSSHTDKIEHGTTVAVEEVEEASIGSPMSCSSPEVSEQASPSPPPSVHSSSSSSSIFMESAVPPRMNCATQTSDTPRLSRRKTPQEVDCERLSKDFASFCQDQALKTLLVPVPEHKTMSDYMAGLFVVESSPELRRSRPKSSSPTQPSKQHNGIHNKDRNHHQALHSEDCPEVKVIEEDMNKIIPASSAYFTTSEPKAKLLNRISQDLSQHHHRQEWNNDRELDTKKEELIGSISRKLDLLRDEQVLIKEEVQSNEGLGLEVASRVEAMAKPKELAKYRLHLDETDKIVNLLMGLSGRLARAQNALTGMPNDVDPDERKLMEAKRDKLLAQHEEARHLKESIDRRSQQVSTFLHRYLSGEEFGDYEHFVKMRSKLLIDARELDEKIKLGEEQLKALIDGASSHSIGSATEHYRTHTRTGSTSV